ncbi:hypothetical protein KHA80_00620 [Anaerobacillus sp. HL2]|nr:hypothetical protein KHA80_00620 [Anaerobacillus sp. HL2]
MKKHNEDEFDELVDPDASTRRFLLTNEQDEEEKIEARTCVKVIASIAACLLFKLLCFFQYNSLMLVRF